ncbi:FtsK/SpoIIIE domain-containing protein [Pseudobacillus badius]|uniref:FtsK/SpoIIIE domain-containing protein n=1 Tax=Bacillus badius TaxID=1455 RepID=UPI0007B0B396|nr:FtsK/SpoIIIE domain-containing protein [Bacillus badius]KZO00620.1 cell division protein FtsK [Bacillus badius]OCS87861.1 cell division protein FtsK [Bacillus badius]OVE47185.1 cell division protein FtsK [Bacillus badius]TDV98983.1 S-DNA-T family DNA segregation ATPase FtsK/SpoIIIE [Bacillus badius]
MFFEIASSIVMGGVVGYTFLLQSGSTNDAAKIQRIAVNAGLVVKEKKETRTIQLLRKTSYAWGTEYAYRIPLGLSFSDFQKKQDHLQDGLNNKRSLVDISLKDLKTIDWRSSVLEQIRQILAKKKTQKEIFLSYDGVLKIKVYNEPLVTNFGADESLFDENKGWEVVVGMSRTGKTIHDFERRPHMIAAGATGYGKSEFIKLLITALTYNQPENVRFNLIDLKGGLELGRFKDMKQVTEFGRNPSEAKDILKKIQKDMNQTLDDLFEKGFKDVKEAGQKERIFVVIDEAADIADDKACMAIVTDIARRGRAAGYRLIYATQYPTNETLPSQVRANIGARMCFRLETGAQSRAVLDEEGAEKLPEIEGRAIFRRVKNEIVQTPYIQRESIERVIQPHIVIKSREDDSNGEKPATGAERGSGTLIVEEIGLS